MCSLQRKILLGVTGGIAAYKSAELVRSLRALGFTIKVIMTASATKFITPLTMQTLSGNKVYTDLFAEQAEFTVEHIELAKWADLILIAPATANFISRLAHGLADDLLATVCLATKVPLVLAPAMNCNMWSNAVTKENVKKLEDRGVKLWGPATGIQACGDVGQGRMLEPKELMQYVQQVFNSNALCGRKVVITAGPTYEPIDPVRFIGNYSSGKMGYALAKSAIMAGANVTLVSGPSSELIPQKAHLIKINTAQQMYDAVMVNINSCDIFIAVAAVADYSPVNISSDKIKKGRHNMTIKLKPTPDILAAVAAMPDPPFTIGFAAETENLMENAKNKLINKKVDMIIANQVGAGLGFGADDNQVIIFCKDGKEIVLPREHKEVLAQKIIAIISSCG